MIKRLKTNAGVALGLSALALGGPAAALAATTSQTTAHHAAVKRVTDRVDAGSRNERAKASDRDPGKKAEHTSKDLHGDK